MSDENKVEQELYSKDLFDKEMDMIDAEIEELDSLFTELKTHFDGIKNSQARGSLSFIKDQTSNLISIKSAKLNYIKQRADMKKNLTDFAFKDKTISSKESTDGIDNISAEIVKKIANEIKYVPVQNTKTIDTDEENNIDKLLDEELDDVNIDTIVEAGTNIEEVEVNYNVETSTIDENEDLTNTNLEEAISDIEEDDNSIIVVDLDTLLFYSINKDDFSIIDELGSIERIVDSTEIEGDTYAIGESGTIYLTITFEDDEDE